MTERSWRMVHGNASGSPSARRFVSRTRRWRLRAVAPYLTLSFVLVTAAAVGWTIFGTAVFSAETVRVEGASTVSADEIRRIADVPAGVPLARLDTAAITERVKTIAPVGDATVTRSWPSTLTITIHERSAVAVFARGDGWVLMDGAGVAFRTVAQRPDGLPLISVPNPRPGDDATAAALTVAGQLDSELRKKLTVLSAPTAEQVTLELAGGRTVFWGDSQDNARKSTVANVLLARPGKRIDVSDPDVVTVR